MTVFTKQFPVTKHDVYMALVVTRREVKDAFRDWRIVIPIILLTAAFPGIMNFTARRLLSFVEDFGAEIIANQLIPFLLLVVGFFPISFSLIVALETFVGEKERKSLEPLLATPVTNTQLYVGKMLASLIPPICASYLGMTLYLVSLYFSVGWLPSLPTLVQTVLISTMQGVIMVAAAVVVSSQTTSVRAANLLASFIIVPIALLLPSEAVAMFWGNHVGLWWLIVALAVTAVVFIRMGIQIFNREELMGRDIDQIRVGWMWQQFWDRFSGRAENNGRYPHPLLWYRQTVGRLRLLGKPILILVVALIATVIFTTYLARVYQLPPQIKAELTGDNMLQNLNDIQVFANVLPPLIFVQNIRAVALWTLLGVFTFGVLGMLVFLLPWGLITYVAVQFALAGQNPWQFLLGTIVPHAVIELPALLIAAAASLRWHTTIISPPPNRTVSEAFLAAAGDFFRLFVGVVIPLLLVAAFVEGLVTPQVLLRVYGG
ncbi:MAG: stage II sporulation protein M [Ardenticatenaceae bacterium]|nr:stage II sporulation protein M [Ardenticatenaceae bacterium]